MKIKAVLFDLDNTLYASKLLHEAWLKEVFLYLQSNYALKCSLDEFYTINKQVKKELEMLYGRFPLSHERVIRMKRILQKLNISYTVQTLEEIYLIYKNYIAEYIQPDDWVEELLVHLRKKGLKLAIISDGNTRTKMKRLRQLGIIQYFDTIVCSDMFWVSKPDPILFLEVMNDLNLTPSEAIYIWDNPVWDIVGGENMKMESIWIDREEKKMPSYITPDYTIKHISDLKALITKFV